MLNKLSTLISPLYISLPGQLRLLDGGRGRDLRQFTQIDEELGPRRILRLDTDPRLGNH